MDRAEVEASISDNGVRVIRLFFTDILGRMKGLNIHVDELDRALTEGIAFDGSSIEGFVRIEESDLIAMPDLRSFRLFPLDNGGEASAMFMCDVLRSDGTPLPMDPRRILQAQLERAAALGYDHFYVGPELEFFYFPGPHDPTLMDSAGYFDMFPLDTSSEAREKTSVELQKLGMRVEATHHEVAASQHEIDFRYGDALEMADNVMIARMIIKEVARQHGLYATFMPKPVAGINGSGMHVHQSLFTGSTNAFYDPDADYHLSEVARRYVAGLLRHAKEITVVTNQWVNSYKRLVPGYEAPVYVCWGQRNRSTLCRVPDFKKGKGNSCRVEYRAPDPGANPYLAFAAMLGAGLTGIEERYELEDPKEQNIFHMSAAEKAESGITNLPGDLYGATLEASKSTMLREVLGADLFEKLLANKHQEWEDYRVAVTDYELETYLPVL